MKITMKTLAAGPDGVKLAGKVYEVPGAEAMSFINGGYAVAALVKPVVKTAEIKRLDQVAAALKAAEEAHKAARNVLAKAKKEEKPAAGKALAEAKQALQAAQDALRRQEEIEAAKAR